ncbi:MAG: hypothetical protein OXU20_32025 [Myxococcales bacterium]|nr:hypothetical protein [Myxococcales bacterium]
MAGQLDGPFEQLSDPARLITVPLLSGIGDLMDLSLVLGSCHTERASRFAQEAV